MSAHAKKVERKRLYKMVKKNPRFIQSKRFIKRASLVNFKLPVTIRLRNTTTSNNPNLANVDLGASLGQRQIGLGGSLSGEIVFHDSYDGGALGNVEVNLLPGSKTLTTTSLPLLWNDQVTASGTSVAKDFFGLSSGNAGCGDFQGNSPLTINSQSGAPYWSSQASYDSNASPAGYINVIPGVDDPQRLIASAAVGSSDNLGPTPNPFPYSPSFTPGGFPVNPSVKDSVLRTAPLSLGIAASGTPVNQTDASPNGPQGSQNIVIGKSGGQANLFGNIPGKGYGIDVTVNLATRINSILRSTDPDFQPLISGQPWNQNFAQCRQAYTGAVQNYIPGVRLQGSLKISPAITSDGKLRIAKATLSSLQPANLALAACIYPYSLYAAEANGSDTNAQTVNTSSLPTNEYAARPAPSGVDCGVTPTKLLQDAPVNNITAAQSAHGYTTSSDGKRVSVAGDISVSSISADILVGDVDSPPETVALSSGGSDYYLALGDSIGYGYQSGLFNTQLGAVFAGGGNRALFNANAFNFGYVDVFGNYLKTKQPGLTVINDACPGETTTSLINGWNKSAAPAGYCGPNATVTSPPANAFLANGFPQDWLHHPYGIGNTQLNDAVAQLQAHPNTKAVTINIGANNLLAFITSCGGFSGTTCILNGVQGQINTIVNDNKQIIEALQAQVPAGAASYTIMGIYNPYPTLLSLGGGLGGDSLMAQLNAKLKQVAADHGAHFVDPLPVFNPSGSAGGSETGDVGAICNLTGMCPGGTLGAPGADIHPSVKGYQALGSLFESAAGF